MQLWRVAAVAAVLWLPVEASAQRYDRDRTWDFGFAVLDTGSERVAGDFDTTLEIEGDYGASVWGAYHFNDHWAVTIDWTHVQPKYAATYRVDGGGLETLQHEANIDHLHFKGTYHFLDGDMTPFVEVGIGWSWLDSNVATGPPSTGCWWDPWWGYICAPFYSTYSSRSSSFSYAVGYRWDVFPGYSVRLDYGVVDVDMSDFTDSARSTTLRLGFAWRF